MSEAQTQPEADPLESWSTEDKEWLQKHVQEVMKPAAIRHGRKLFALTMLAGASTHALVIISRQGRGNRAVTAAARMLERSLDQLAGGLLASFGKTLQDFQECQVDIERLAALADAGQRLPGERVSKGGIVLDS